LLAHKKLSWVDQETVEELIQRQLVVAQETKEISDAIEKRCTVLEEEFIVNQESYVKMLKELSVCLRELETEKMVQAIERLHVLMRQLDPKEIEKTLNNITSNQQELNKCLERTRRVLMRMDQEQELKTLLGESEKLPVNKMRRENFRISSKEL
ncbi:hypothetical protein IIA15_08525, partial [candidate division TA06 bacterium]|nr:hypothetical protein [candidate division TA06 bacterium]